MTNVLITGGTGSLGHALAPEFLNSGYRVTILSRDPHKQTLMRLQYPDINFVLGDICDRELMLDLCEDQDIVVHAAALKIVGDAQKNTKEYMRVNVLGALNTAEACRLNGVGKCILISSDKACAATTSYGKTKALAEELWLAQNTTHNIAQFSAVRYGNVVSSNGSVWHLWRKALENGGVIAVKEPEPTRFILTMTQAIQLITAALQYMHGGEIFVPGNIPAFSLFDLAYQMQPDKSMWYMSPLLPSEKQHEIMVAPTEYVEPVIKLNDMSLWRILPHKTQTWQETAPMFASEQARRISGKEVIELINAH